MQPMPGVTCRFYGKSHAILKHSGQLVDLMGRRSNECAASFTSYAPCRMERLGYSPDEGRCPIARGYLRQHPV